MNIRLLKRDEIEDARWNGCVHHASNSRVYGYTWYLDNVCDEWCGLVEDNYMSVFPLPFNEKLLGHKQLYQPLLTQQLGIFSVSPLNKFRIEHFFKAIPLEFKLININLNDKNNISVFNQFKITKRKNFLLYLNEEYQHIYDKYSKNVKRNINKAKKETLKLSNHIKPEVFVDFVKSYHKSRKNNVPEAIYHTALRIIYNAMHRGIGFFSVISNSNDEVSAAIFFIKDQDRIINLLNFTSEYGRTVGAMHFLLDINIQKFANSPIYLDFEGSEIDGVAKFYESFGAKNAPYSNVYHNRLPWYIKWLKPK